MNNNTIPPMSLSKVNLKIGINIGATFDIPTGTIITGKKGEAIINGGLALTTGVSGTGNNYKSTILHFMMLRAAKRVSEATETRMTTNDTEMNIDIERLKSFAINLGLPEDVLEGEDPMWLLTDKASVSGNDFFKEYTLYCSEKGKNKNYIIEYEALTDPFTKKPLKLPIPTFTQIDSITEFEGTTSIDMLNDDLEDKNTNTYAMKQGLFKTKAFTQIPRLAKIGNNYTMVTAQIGEKIDMDNSPMAKYNKPSRASQYLKSKDNIKGGTSKFFFLLLNSWQAHTATLLKNQTTRLPEFPWNADESVETELNTVTLTQLRGKSGFSGISLKIVVSQIDGVIPELTDFLAIKDNGKYGFVGNDRSYSMALYPGVKLSRTTVRKKLSEDKRLRRAVEIQSEIVQLKKFHPRLINKGYFCPAEELYEDIKKMGYDWNTLLDARGYATINQYTHPVPYLHTLDILRMRLGEYHPYWYPTEGIKNPCLDKGK